MELLNKVYQVIKDEQVVLIENVFACGIKFDFNEFANRNNFRQIKKEIYGCMTVIDFLKGNEFYSNEYIFKLNEYFTIYLLNGLPTFYVIKKAGDYLNIDTYDSTAKMGSVIGVS